MVGETIAASNKAGAASLQHLTKEEMMAGSKITMAVTAANMLQHKTIMMATAAVNNALQQITTVLADIMPADIFKKRDT